MLRVLCEIRHTLDRRRAGADHGNPLVRELVQISGGIPARISVVPATGVKGVPLVAVDSWNPGKLGAVQRPVGHDHESGPHAVVTVSGDDPSALVVVPGDLFDLSLKA